MELSVVRIGNSRGIRLPAKLLERFRITDKVEVVEDGSRLILRAAASRKSRVGWAKAFRNMASFGDDRLLIDTALDAGEDWTW
jgi:antitoxin MazE